MVSTSLNAEALQYLQGYLQAASVTLLWIAASDPMGPGWFLRNHVDSWAQLCWNITCRFSTSIEFVTNSIFQRIVNTTTISKWGHLCWSSTGKLSGLWLHGTSIYNAMYGHGLCWAFAQFELFQIFGRPWLWTLNSVSKPFVLKLVFLSSFVLLSVSLSFYWKCEQVKNHLSTCQAVHIL